MGSALSGACGSVLCVGSSLVVPAFAQMFLEVGVCLPASTEFVTGIPNWGWCGLSALSILLMTLKDRWLRPRFRRRANGLYVVLVVAAGVWLVSCLFSPLIVLQGPF